MFIETNANVPFCSSDRVSTSTLDISCEYFFLIKSASASFNIAFVNSVLSITARRSLRSQFAAQLSSISSDFSNIVATVSYNLSLLESILDNLPKALLTSLIFFFKSLSKVFWSILFSLLNSTVFLNAP